MYVPIIIMRIQDNRKKKQKIHDRIGNVDQDHVSVVIDILNRGIIPQCDVDRLSLALGRNQSDQFMKDSLNTSTCYNDITEGIDLEQFLSSCHSSYVLFLQGLTGIHPKNTTGKKKIASYKQSSI